MKTEIEKLKEERKDLDLKIKSIEKENKERVKNRKSPPSNVEIRVSHLFNNKIEDINEDRKYKGLKKISKPKLTAFITIHKFWEKITNDLKKCDSSVLEEKLKKLSIVNNKSGQLTITLVVLIILAFLTTIILFSSGVVLSKIDNALDQDIQLGQVNLRDINNDTFGVYVDSFLNNADWWGLSIIVGMILGLIISSYLVRNRFPKIGVILDIFIIFIAFIISLYISSTYQIILDSLQSAGEPFLEQYTPKTSFFVLNLPIFISIIGVVIMFLFHSSIPKKDDEKYQDGGYLKGVQ